jgi:hypothetical protein
MSTVAFFRNILTETFIFILVRFSDDLRRTAGIIKKRGAMRTAQWMSTKLITYDANMRVESPTAVTTGIIIGSE